MNEKTVDYQAYQMPDQLETEDGKLDLKKREKILTQRYEDVKNLPNEHELWEQAQIDRSKTHYRTTNTSEGDTNNPQSQYDLLLEN